MGGGHSRLTGSEKAGRQVLYGNVIAHLLRNLEFVVKRSRTKCAMTGLNILSHVFLGEGVRRTGEGFVGRQEDRKFRRQANISNEDLNTPTITNLSVVSQPSCPQNFCSSDFYPPALIRDAVTNHNCEPSGKRMLPVQNNRNGGNAMLIPPYVPVESHNALKSLYKAHVAGAAATLPKRTYSLINLFSYSLHKKVAFTLAEVLITLGIIGVVAAMTMPALIANHKQKELETGLKKAYSVAQQALLLMSADRGDVVPSFGLREFYSEYIKYFNNAIDCGIDTSKNFACGLAQDYKDYSGVVKITSAYTDDGQFVLPDGMNIYIQNENGNEDRNANIYISVDVNGAKKRPNKWGHDLFTFQLMSDGKLMPMGIEGTDFYEKECSRTTASNKNGIGCTYEAINNPSYFKSLP